MVNVIFFSSSYNVYSIYKWFYIAVVVFKYASYFDEYVLHVPKTDLY